LPDALLDLPQRELRQIATIDGADHFYAGCGEQLAAEIARWLTSTKY
jgi:hypothetical protein